MLWETRTQLFIGADNQACMQNDVDSSPFQDLFSVVPPATTLFGVLIAGSCKTTRCNAFRRFLIQRQRECAFRCRLSLFLQKYPLKIGGKFRTPTYSSLHGTVQHTAENELPPSALGRNKTCAVLGAGMHCKESNLFTCCGSVSLRHLWVCLAAFSWIFRGV